jgi:CRISPR-associated endonuclease/helicase Cas3
MPKIDEATKQQRLDRIHLLLARNARGITEAEIADEMGLERRTANNYLRELEFQGKAFKDGLYWYPLVLKESRLRPFDLSPEEAVTLYLGARLLSKQQDKRNEPAETALLKLASVLKADAGVGDEIEQAARELAQRPAREGYQPIFRDVVRGYIYRKKVELSYRPLNAQKSFPTTFSTYLLEPSPIGFSTYLIGHSSIVNALRAYKLERIEAVRLTSEPYAIPPDFPGLEILRNAWSIVMGEQTLRVVLRFSPQVKARVLETRWHPSQITADDPERPDWLRWQVDVADTLDLLPWVRGWGADVEVLEPEELRKVLVKETKALARIYGLAERKNEQDPTMGKLLRLWGKTERNNPDPETFHPALFHMLDVGNMALALLTNPAAVRIRKTLERALGQSLCDLRIWLPWLVAMHDIGKVSAAFQAINKGQLTRLTQEGFSFDGWNFNSDVRHEVVSQVYFAEKLSNTDIYLEKAIGTWAEVVGGHHGRYQHPDTQIKHAHRELTQEPAEWQTYREIADALLRRTFGANNISGIPQPDNHSTEIMALTGFMILCDWIGSDGRYFCPEPDTDFENYVQKSGKRAEKAVSESGLLAGAASIAPIDVTLLFDDLGGLRPLQLAINEIPAELLHSPSLTIIEAPTGEGKTEAALALAHRIAQANGTEELYYALPTMATSNQMFGRLQTHLRDRLGLPTAVKLVHGQSFLVEEELRDELNLAFVEPLGNGGNPNQSEVGETISWFNTKKRSLLAPFGVGTIDQAELASLNVKHTALRMMGLAGKVVIVDEVHAYDTYMLTIIERLLKWLAAMNTSVILLSATLPKARRKQLVEAYGVPLDLPVEKDDLYPSLLVLSQQGVFHTSAGVWQPNRAIHLDELHLGDDDARTKAEWLLNAVKDGGCACWITNTVRRAQRIYEELLPLASPDVQLDLLHSQYPLDERQRREGVLTDLYSRNGQRPASGKGIVVGTQVLEQSLDLDFDVMVSDLAPIDLLLQRAGRLHRHDRQRLAAHSTPCLYINYEVNPNGEWKSGSDRKIYAEFIMCQTYRTLKNIEAKQICLPADYRRLIEAVYSDQPPAADDPLYESWKELEKDKDKAYGEASQRLLPAPYPRDSFALEAAMRIKFEEDEGRADWIVAQTRLGEETINIIPIEKSGGFALLPDGEKVDINAKASLEIQRKLLKRNMRISQRDAIALLKERKDSKEYLTPLFKESTLLKGYYPVWLTNGKTEFRLEKGTLRICLDKDLGLKITKEG